MHQAIILAGGQGTRLRAAVPDLPKPLAPVNGRPFLEHQIAYWANRGVEHFVLSVGYKAEMVVEHFGKQFAGARISYAVETTPLGTGGGLLLAAQHLDADAPVLAMNGDTFFDVSLSEIRRFHTDRAAAWTISLFRTATDGRYMGMKTEPDGRITALSSGEFSASRLANGGLYLVSPGVLDELAKRFNGRVSLEDDILPALLASNYGVYGIEQSGRFIDIGVPADYRRAADILQN